MYCVLTTCFAGTVTECCMQNDLFAALQYVRHVVLLEGME